MKYNFDTVHDRINDPYSYSYKYQLCIDDIPSTRKFGFGGKKFPPGTIVLFHADMDFDIAPAIVNACVKAAQFPNYGYSAPRKPYYESVRRWFAVRHDWHFTADDVYECVGTHAGVAEVVKKFTNPGAGVIVFTPSYSFEADVTPFDRHYVSVPFIKNGHKFSIDWDSFEKEAEKPENEAFIIVQPHNPLGFIFTVKEMQRIAEICRKNNVLMIADMVHIDIYRKGVKPVPLAKAVGNKGVVSLTGLAKTFNISGLNMSNIIITDPELKEKMGYRYTGTTPFGVAAATAAYTECDDWVDELNEYLDKLVDYTCDFLDKNMPKVKYNKPQASYVFFLDFSDYGLTSEELDERIAKKALVALANGSIFGGGEMNQWRRMCMTAPLATIKEALDRLKDAFADIE